MLGNTKNDKTICKQRTLDATDHQILRLLHADGRRTQESIAHEVFLSRPAVHDRVKRLEETGVITGYQAQIDWRKVGQALSLFVWVRTSGGKLHDLADAIMTFSNRDTLVEECHLITGDWCLLLKVRTVSTTSLQILLNRLRDMPRVRNTMTTLVLSSAGENFTEIETQDELSTK